MVPTVSRPEHGKSTENSWKIEVARPGDMHSRFDQPDLASRVARNNIGLVGLLSKFLADVQSMHSRAWTFIRISS